MSSYAWYEFENGLVDTFGGVPNYLDDNSPSPSTQWFATAKEAFDYAKNNIGVVIVRSSDGNGFVVKN